MNKRAYPSAKPRVAPRIAALVAALTINMAFATVFVYGGQPVMQRSPLAHTLTCSGAST